jgi:hypothetical protein
MTASLTSLTLPLDGVIERRLLITYRLDPNVARTLLPAGLRPQLVDGSAVAGICMIRLGGLRPHWLTAKIGWRMENAAHRIAVEWHDQTGVHAGVYIPERHSASWLPVAVGGRLFPGIHHHAHFQTNETADRISVQLTAAHTTVVADTAITDKWSSSLFRTLGEASEFFRCGNVGLSPSRRGHTLEGLQLEADSWHVAPGQPLHVASSYFDTLPAGTAILDNILVMRDIPIRWSRPETGSRPTVVLQHASPAADRA